MSAYSPPNQTLTVFNINNFIYNDNLTISQANASYLKLTGGTESGLVSFAAGLKSDTLDTNTSTDMVLKRAGSSKLTLGSTNSTFSGYATATQIHTPYVDSAADVDIAIARNTVTGINITTSNVQLPNMYLQLLAQPYFYAAVNGNSGAMSSATDYRLVSATPTANQVNVVAVQNAVNGMSWNSSVSSSSGQLTLPNTGYYYISAYIGGSPGGVTVLDIALTVANVVTVYENSGTVNSNMTLKYSGISYLAASAVLTFSVKCVSGSTFTVNGSTNQGIISVFQIG